MLLRRRTCTLLLSLLIVTLVSRCREKPAVCFDCFWEHQPEGLRAKVAAFYAEPRYADPLAEAERLLIHARVAGDRESLRRAYRGFTYTRDLDPARRLVAAESSAFLARESGADFVAAFTRAAAVASETGDPFKASVYRALAAGTFAPRFGEQQIRRTLSVPRGATSYILGSSSIFVPSGARVSVQAERTVRDWLSYQLLDDYAAKGASASHLVDWHEGARLRELLSAASVDARPARGTLAARRDGKWFAADEDGVFRFEILADKIQYPATRVHGDVALLMDTHGVAAIERDAARSGAVLALACGDHPSKMQAAYRLASRGVSVWFPCDRFAGEIVGHDAPGTLLGSAPVRAAEGGAIIGDTPVAFRFDENIVVQDTREEGVTQYYDAAARYFHALERSAPLRAEYLTVDAPGQSSRIVARARQSGAKAVALRVASEADAAPLRAWLAESREHRAVLFHSAPYPEGFALFRQFPGQTTFGDPRPRFR